MTSANNPAMGFYEEDEPVHLLVERFEGGDKGRTAPPVGWQEGAAAMANVEASVRVVTDAPPLTFGDIERFVAKARATGATDTTPVRFEVTIGGGRAKAISARVPDADRPPDPTGLETKGACR